METASSMEDNISLKDAICQASSYTKADSTEAHLVSASGSNSDQSSSSTSFRTSGRWKEESTGEASLARQAAGSGLHCAGTGD